jgi:hypothetical protein
VIAFRRLTSSSMLIFHFFSISGLDFFSPHRTQFSK